MLLTRNNDSFLSLQKRCELLDLNRSRHTIIQRN